MCSHLYKNAISSPPLTHVCPGVDVFSVFYVSSVLPCLHFWMFYKTVNAAPPLEGCGQVQIALHAISPAASRSCMNTGAVRCSQWGAQLWVEPASPDEHTAAGTMDSLCLVFRWYWGFSMSLEILLEACGRWLVSDMIVLVLFLFNFFFFLKRIIIWLTVWLWKPITSDFC